MSIARERLELLAVAGEMFSRSLEPRETLQAIATLLVPRVCDWCRIDLVDAEGVLQRAVTYHRDPEKARYGAELAARLRAAPGQVGSMAWAFETGQSHTAHFDPPIEFDQMRDRDLLTFSQAIGLRAYYILPLISRGRTLGALAAMQAESGRPITDDDRALISEIVQRAALAIDNARLYAETEAARRQAEAANRAKDEFLAMLGHELRNPLAPIATALKLMEMRQDGGASEERRVIERQVGHLSRLVDDLLDVSRISQGKVQLQRERVDMKAIVAQALELSQPAHAVEAELTAGPAFVEGDAVRLVQVLCNLLNNAAKYTPPEGRITLKLAASGAHVVTTVRDTGIGIAPYLLPRVFDAFQQGDQPLDRKTGGLGLGLAIVKALVEMHGGSVTAESRGPGQGSLFKVTLPAATDQAPAAAEQVSAPPVAGSGRILVVDDNADAAAMLTLMLEQLGYEARSAYDGPGALAEAARFVPDVAILDIGLPGMNGYELARALKADPRLDGIRLLAVTGYGRESDRARALAGDFDEHLVKPVAPARMLKALQALIGDR